MLFRSLVRAPQVDLVAPEEVDRAWGAVQDQGRRAATTTEMAMIVTAMGTAELGRETCQGRKVADMPLNQSGNTWVRWGAIRMPTVLCIDRRQYLHFLRLDSKPFQNRGFEYFQRLISRRGLP